MRDDHVGRLQRWCNDAKCSQPAYVPPSFKKKFAATWPMHSAAYGEERMGTVHASIGDICVAGFGKTPKDAKADAAKLLYARVSGSLLAAQLAPPERARSLESCGLGDYPLGYPTTQEFR